MKVLWTKRTTHLQNIYTGTQLGTKIIGRGSDTTLLFAWIHDEFLQL